MQIHEKIRAMRQIKNLTQEELAEKLGYSLSGYAKIERGETDISLGNLEKIAQVLEVDFYKLIGLHDGNTLNVLSDCHYSVNQGSIVLSETQCAHELEKASLLLQEKLNEITYLKNENTLLKEMLALLKNQ